MKAMVTEIKDIIAQNAKKQKTKARQKLYELLNRPQRRKEDKDWKSYPFHPSQLFPSILPPF